MNKFKKTIFLLIFMLSANSILANPNPVDINVGEEEAEVATGILGSFARLKDRFCDCNTSARTVEKSDINNVFSVWSTLLEANPNLVTEMMKSIHELSQVNEAFSESNDPNSFGLVVYMLKVFTEIGARSGEIIDSKDIGVVLEIMKDHYGVELPPVATSILGNIKELRTVKGSDNSHRMTLVTKNGSPIVINPTELGLPNSMNRDDRVRVENLTIQNGATITFYDNDSEMGACQVNSNRYENCRVQHRMMSFFTPRTGFTPKHSNFDIDRARSAFNHIARTANDEISPLFVEFDGIDVHSSVKTLGRSPARVAVSSAVVLPNANGTDANSLYLGTNITLLDGFALFVKDNSPLEIEL